MLEKAKKYLINNRKKVIVAILILVITLLGVISISTSNTVSLTKKYGFIEGQRAQYTDRMLEIEENVKETDAMTLFDVRSTETNALEDINTDSYFDILQEANGKTLISKYDELTNNNYGYAYITYNGDSIQLYVADKEFISAAFDYKFNDTEYEKIDTNIYKAEIDGKRIFVMKKNTEIMYWENFDTSLNEEKIVDIMKKIEEKK